MTEKNDWNLRDVVDWAKGAGEPKDSIRAIHEIPARLGMLDADLTTLPASVEHFERVVAGSGYALVSRAKDMERNGRRRDSRARSLLRRFEEVHICVAPRDAGIRERYTRLMDLIERQEGRPGSGSRWNIGRHRSMTILRARARCAPEDLDPKEIERLSCEMTAEKRKALRKAIAFLNSLKGLTNEIPELREFLPSAPLPSPSGSSRGRKIKWAELPEAFRNSFDKAAETCLAGPDDFAEQQLARIEAGEDPETVMAEADSAAAEGSRDVSAQETACDGYRAAVSWLLRSWEDAGGEVENLNDIRILFDRPTIELAIRDQITRAMPDFG